MSSQSDTLPSLTAARSLINGCQHQSNICTGTQNTTRFAEIDYRNLLFVTTAALSMICQSLVEASYVFIGTCKTGIGTGRGNNCFKTSKIAQEALAFVQGTGIEITLKRYGLDYDADLIQAEFRRIFHIDK